MKLIKANFNIIEQGSGIDGIYKIIEQAGRTCYKSLDKITPDSAKGFVDRMIKSGHGAMLEHGTVYLKVPVNIDIAPDFLDDVATWTKCKLVQENTGNWWAITTNYRRIIECNYLDHLKYLCEPTEYHEKRITVKFLLPISISREFCRHRVFSFAEMSTRYCNYNADKFNNELTFIIPYWSSLKEARYVYWDGDYVENTTPESLPHKILKHVVGDEDDMFLSVCEQSELTYRFLTNKGMKAQEAREVLPLCTKTELIMTGTIEQWKGFFKLRCDAAAHPQARELAIPLKEEFKKLHYIND